MKSSSLFPSNARKLLTLLMTTSSLHRHVTTTVPHFDAFTLLTNATQLLQSSTSHQPHIDHSLNMPPHEGQNARVANALKLLDEMLERGQRTFWVESLSQFPHTRRKLVRVCEGMIIFLLENDCVNDAIKMSDQMLQVDSKADYRFCPKRNLVFGYVLGGGKNLGGEKIADILLKFGQREVFPSLSWLSKLIVMLCGNGESNVAWDILQALMKLGFKIDNNRFNYLLMGLGRIGDIKSMDELMAKMKELNIPPNVITYGIVTKYLCQFGRVDEAMELIQRMSEGEETNEVLDVVTYNTLIDRLCKIGMLERALGLMEQMRFQKGCAPDTVTYNCLIDGFCKAGDLERGNKLFEEMHKDEVFPNVVTLNTLLCGMCRLGRIDSAVQFFGEMRKKGLKGDADSYSILIDAACRTNNMKKALHIFYQMSRDEYSAAAIVCYKLISCLSNDGRMNNAIFVLSKLKAAGLCPDILCYNILIGGFCRLGELDKAYNLFNEEVGVNPDVITYNTLISYFSKAGNFRIAHKLIWKMIKAGLSPTIVTYKALIHAYCFNGNVDGAMRVFKDMVSTSNVLPDIVIYNILIDSMCKNNDVELALLLMDDMRVKSVKPNTTTYNAIFKGLREKNLLSNALLLMDRMTEQACTPDTTTMEILTEWLSSVGEEKNLSNFAKWHSVLVSNA